MSATDGLIAQRYRLRRLVGTGGMGVVWEAYDERLHRTVAIKQLHPQPGLSEAEAEVVTSRAMREARITARLQHPHAVPVFDVIEEQGRPCLVMQFLPSEPLSSVLQRRGVMPEPQVADLGAQVAAALAAAHKVGIVHRDVKPGNVLIAEDGAARISDFGIAHALGDVTLTSTGMVTGTPAYLAPEVARGEKSGFPADVFSLGATLYTALEGHPPFGTDPNRMALLHRVASGVIIPPQRSGALTSLLVEMLAAHPDDRPTMNEVVAGLTALRDPAHASAQVAPELASGLTTESTAPPPTAGMPVLPAERGPRPPERRQPQRNAETVTAPPPVRPTGPRAVLPSNPPQRRRRGMAILASLVLGLLVLLGLFLQSRRDDGQVGITPPAASSTTSVGATTSAPGASTPTTLPAAPAPVPPPPSSAATPSGAATPRALSTATTSPPPSTPVSGTPGAADLARAVSGYYAQLPSGTDQTWPLLTANYQTKTAGGRQAYQRFWGQYSRVTATDVTATAPSTAQATITYYGKDGRVIRERTSFNLVNDGGVLKIDSSRVLTSTG